MSKISLTREFSAQGLHADDLARMRRRQELVHVRRGAYAEPLADLDRRNAHLQLLEATMRQSSSEAVASHISAAAVHDLPLWDDLLATVHLTRDRHGGGQCRRYSQIHGLPLTADEVEVVDGFLVTTLARTVLDLACSLSMARAVAMGDAALRRPRAPNAEGLADQLDRAGGRKGVRMARRTIAFLDARSESAGESVSRVVFAQQGVAPPELQVEVRDAYGNLVGRCDFDWDEFATVGEFDGKIKYGRSLREGQPLEEVLFDEKVREDRIRDVGKQMVRWIWVDLRQPGRLRERLERAFSRGRRR